MAVLRSSSQIFWLIEQLHYIDCIPVEVLLLSHSLYWTAIHIVVIYEAVTKQKNWNSEIYEHY